MIEQAGDQPPLLGGLVCRGGFSLLLLAVMCLWCGGCWCDHVVVDIELGDAVAALRDELLDASDRATDAEVEFVVGPVVLEFMVELKVDARAKAGFKAWVISADAEAGASRASNHKVTVTLTPRRPGGGELLVARKSGGATGPGEVSGHIGR